MKKNDTIIIIFGVVILLVAMIGIITWVPQTNDSDDANIEEFFNFSGEIYNIPNAITVSDDDPFYALIATPLAVHYTPDGQQQVIPLYIKNFSDPSKAVERAEQMIGLSSNLIIGGSNTMTIKDVSLNLAKTYWKKSSAALVFQYNQTGYDLGVSATPLASYLGIPIIVTNVIDDSVRETFDLLGVTHVIICGNISGYGQKSIYYTNADDILNATIELVQEKFGDIRYITLTNPIDITKAEVLDKVSYNFEGTLSTTSFTASGIGGMIGGMLRGIPFQSFHKFEVPDDYKYAKLKITAINLVDENVDETGSQLQPMLIDPDGEQLAYLFTVGGIPERNSNGEIIEDKIDFEITMYNKPGEYALMVSGKYLTKKNADYKIDITVEKLNSSIEPNMPCLSSIAPYLTAYHQGIVLAKPEFVFVADEEVIVDPSPGVAYPSSNPGLIDEVNKHIYEKIHKPLNEILTKISNMDLDLNDDDDLRILRDHYDEMPVHIAIVGDSNMIPPYYYYDTPDASTIKYGWDVASDFIYGNIDPVPRDDKVSIYPRDRFIVGNYKEKYPYQENIVGRITGWDVQDASALIARTVFYKNVIGSMDEWVENAVVQTGSGTDFQRLPIFDLLRRVMGGIFGVHDLPIKWPTGEAHFENEIIASSLDSGNFNIKQTENTESMRQPVSEDILKEIKTMGLLNRIFFPKMRASQISGSSSNIYDINGEEDLENSNFIFTFGHGQPMGYQHGDVQTDSLGFKPVLLQNIINRDSVLLPILAGTVLSSGLGNAGGYYVRFVENMELGPSVMFVESCYIGRFDGFPAKCLVSQAYIHAGINTFIASSRGSPGPGYLDARKRPIGIGLTEYIKTIRNPELQNPHFSALIATSIFEDLIDNNVDVGTAFRNARNCFMEDANSTFFWTPPLSLDIHTQDDLDLFWNNFKSTSDTGDNTCMEKKYTCQLEYNLLGDPAFNPYEPVNNG